jgi:lipopolysaccharide export system permease protein
MSILTRYVLRALIGPFVFAFTAVTGLLFLNAVAQKLEDLAGRGLGFDVIGEFMVLSLPHVVALTFPMGVLVAVLYTFADLTGQNEISAMAAGGIRVSRLLAPLLVLGVGFTAFMFWFNASVLPETNYRLSQLMNDVASTNPTLQLREQVVNEVSTGDGTRYFLQASRIDVQTNTLTDVVIYDLSKAGDFRTIEAARGEMAFTPDRADLYVTLFDGQALEVTEERPGAFQWMAFETQVLPMRGVGSELERQVGGGPRTDREMPIPMLRERVAESLVSLHRVAEESREASRLAILETLSLDVGGVPFEALESEDPVGLLGGADPILAEVTATHRINEVRWNVHRLSVYQYRVEIHKKYAIAFACLIFILFGAPFAVRFPQGGVGMVIAASVGVFFLYYAGLIGGERIANRGLMDPVLAMWLPNLILIGPASWMAVRMGLRISTNRGSGWDALRFRIRTLFVRAPKPGRGVGAVGSSRSEVAS